MADTKKTPVQLLEDATIRADLLAHDIEALKAEHGKTVADLAGKVDALTKERDILKAQAEAGAAKVAELEAAKAATDAALADLTGKLTVAEGKLKDPAMLAAGASVAPAPVAGLTGGADGEQESKDALLARLDKEYKAERDPQSRAVLRKKIIEALKQ